MMAAVMAAMVSLIGIAHHTPNTGFSNNKGTNKSSGIRKSTWRVMLKKIDLPAMPIEVKKLPATI